MRDHFYPNKINTLIRRNFCGDTPSVPKALTDFVDVVQLTNLMAFDQVRFDLSIGTSVKKKARSSRWPLVKLGDIAHVLIGGTPPRKTPAYFSGNNLWVSIAEMNGDVIYETKEKITDDGVIKSNVKLIPKGTTLLSFKLSIGKTAIAGRDLYTNEAIAGLIPKSTNEISNSFIFHLFNSRHINLNGSGHKVFGESLNSTFLKENVLTPLPPLGVQNAICRRLARYGSVETALTDCIKTGARTLFLNFSGITVHRPLREFCTLSDARINPGDTPDADFSYIGLEHIIEGTGECTWTVPCKGATIKSTKNVFRKGDVLYGKLRPYLNKVWIAEFDGVCTTEMLVLKPRIPATLLKYLLLAPTFVEQAKAKTGGVSLPRIKPGEVMLIPVPDVDSQVTKLGKIASEIEVEKQRQQAKLERLRRTKHAYLNKWLC